MVRRRCTNQRPSHQLPNQKVRGAQNVSTNVLSLSSMGLTYRPKREPWQVARTSGSNSASKSRLCNSLAVQVEVVENIQGGGGAKARFSSAAFHVRRSPWFLRDTHWVGAHFSMQEVKIVQLTTRCIMTVVRDIDCGFILLDSGYVESSAHQSRHWQGLCDWVPPCGRLS